MKKLIVMAMAMVTVASVAVAQTAAAPAEPAKAPETKVEEKSPLTFAATLDYYSAYVWRGIICNDRPVWQPGATISYSAGDYGTLSANVWQNWNASDRNGHVHAGGLDESDYTLSYTKDVGPVSLEAGHIWYTFPCPNGSYQGSSEYAHSTEEFYAGAALNNSYVTPYIRSYADYNIVKGFYNQVGLRKSVTLTDRLTLNGDANLGLVDKNYVDQYDSDGHTMTPGWWDGNLSAGLMYALTDHVSVGAKLAWMSLLNGEARDKVNDGSTNTNFGKTDTLWGGLNLAASF